MTNSQIYDLLVKGISKDNIFLNEPMKNHTSFKIGGNADFFIKAKDVEEVKFVLEICKTNDIVLTVIGNGSNLLVKDSGIRGIVLKVDIQNIDIQGIQNGSDDNITEDGVKNSDISKDVLVTVGAGVPLGKLAQILLKNSISGFEFASGIPGTIGGAIRMNAGAYGGEFKDIVLETTCMDLDGNIITLPNNKQEFEYRNSIFKNNKYIILESKLLLEFVDDSSIIKDKMDEYKNSRIQKQPIEYPSAGSTFKRGNDFITAKLIDECGLKGYSIGDAQVSMKHAGFVVNTGNATAKDVLTLIEEVKNKVYEKFDKKIELEIEVVGEE